MDPTEAFAAIVRSGEVPLARSALLIAAHDHEVDVEAVLGELDDLAGAARSGDLESVVRAVFVDGKFTGNEDDYYDPDNSFLDRVVDRRTGIPITLAIVLIEVAARAGVRLDAVGLPGHFLVGVPGEQRWIDAFAGGRILERGDVEALFARQHGAGAELEEPLLEPISPTRILARVLANLSVIFRRRQRRRDLVWVHGLRTLLPDVDDDARRAFASALAGAGELGRAADVLASLEDPKPSDAATSTRLRSRLN